MKILFATEYYHPFVPGGTPWSLRRLAQELTARGEQVAIVTPNYGAPARDAVDGVPVFRFPFWRTLRPGASLAPVRDHVNPVFHLLFARALVKAARAVGADVIHAQEKHALAGAALAGWWLNRPVVASLRDFGLICPITTCLLRHSHIPGDCSLRKLQRECAAVYLDHYIGGGRGRRARVRVSVALLYLDAWWKGALLKRVHGVTGVSASVLDIYARAGRISRGQGRVVYNLPPIGPGRPRENRTAVLAAFGLPDRPLVVYVGKLSPGKGFPVFAEAAGLVAGRRRDAVFVAAGAGAPPPAREGVDLRCLGQRGHEEVEALYGVADVVVLPSVWPEPFSRVPLEAAAFGKPVIATKAGGTPEAIEDGRTGVLVERNDPRALADAIVDLLGDEGRRGRLGAAAREFVGRKFAPQEVVRDLRAAYRDTCPSRRAAPPRTIGLLPALGGGLTDLKRSGQHERLLAYDLRHYAEAYDRVYYFSYFAESLADFTRDALLLDRVVVLPRRGPWSRKVYAVLLPLLYAREFLRCDVLRVFQFPGVVPALVARSLFGVPFVVTYGYHYADVARIAGSWLKPRLFPLLERLAFPRAAGVIVTSKEMEALVLSRPRPPRVMYAPNGVDTAHFAPGPAPSAEERTQARDSLLYVGRLEPEKNLERLIRALSLIRSRSVALTIIGDGRLRGELERQAAASGVAVDFRGVVPHGELPEHLNRADVFVLPSLTEGHPKALIEAMACGRPCAVSARGGNLTLVEDGVTGLLFDPEDPYHMARILDRLLTDRALARRLGAAARAHVAARYDAHALLRDEVAFVAGGSRRPPLSQLFEDYAGQYPIDDVVPDFVARRLNELARDRPRAVLDVGAGDGRYLRFFTGVLPADALVVGCEISVVRARRIRAKGFRVVAARSEALPFRDRVFDLVTVLEVIEHTESPDCTLDEVERVLASGGRLALTTPNYPVKRIYDARAALRLRDVQRLRDDPTHISPLSARSLERLLAPRFASVELEGTALLGERHSHLIRMLKRSSLGRRLSNKLFALCVKA